MERQRKPLYEVVVRSVDGHHRANYELPGYMTVREIMERYDFHFKPGTVRVNAQPVDDSELDCTVKQFMDLSMRNGPWAIPEQCLIMGDEPWPKKQKREPVKREDGDDGESE